MTAAVALVCKVPISGQSKTRLSPPLSPNQCAALSVCFIRDTARTIAGLARDGDITPYALYAPAGADAALRTLLPPDFALMPQTDGDLGARMLHGIRDLLNRGHEAAILIGSDCPTVPASIIRAAVAASRPADNVALCRVPDGGYVVIGMSRPHAGLFEGMPWSTTDVYRRTIERAGTLGLRAVELDGWYDVDDVASLRILDEELGGRPPPFARQAGEDAPSTRRMLRDELQALIKQ